MKNIFKYLLIVSLGVFVFSSCEDEDKGIYDGPELVSFSDGTSGNYSVQETGDTGWEIQVGFTTTSNQARVVNYTISGDAADGEQFTLASNSITVPAGSVVGVLTVNGIYGGFTGQVDTLIVTLTGDNVAEFDNTYTLIMQRYCSYTVDDLVGSWSGIDIDNNFGVPTAVSCEIEKVDDNHFVVKNPGMPVFCRATWVDWTEVFQPGFGNEGDVIFELDPVNGEITSETTYWGQTLPGPWDYDSTAEGEYIACDNKLEISLMVDDGWLNCYTELTKD